MPSLISSSSISKYPNQFKVTYHLLLLLKTHLLHLTLNNLSHHHKMTNNPHHHQTMTTNPNLHLLMTNKPKTHPNTLHANPH